MKEYSYVTKGKSDPHGKPRVYFTCHPADFDLYFEIIKEDIFDSHDCVIYHTSDMSHSVDRENTSTDLGSINLLAVPVTYRLLSEPCRAMDEDIDYAKKNDIPILPFMMEQGIDAIYSKADKFGERQYLAPFSTDDSEIAYKEKLKKYLDSVLIDDKTAKRIRAAFDAYIFLSYRKKDRRFANELMRLIHNNPECRDIAVWYDEFLKPGESFAKNIRNAMKKSKVFALLISPSILEEPEGKPNFVMGVEYPEAMKMKKTVFPVEMQVTDREALKEKFRDIPECVNGREEEEFRKRLLSTIERIAVSTADSEPEHKYLIGLAYLDGIDVEVNRERGAALISEAAEEGLLDAMWKLYRMYKNGDGVKLDYLNACKWAERMYGHCSSKFGNTDINTLNALEILASAYNDAGNHEKASELQESSYALHVEELGEEHPETLTSLFNLIALSSDGWHHQRVYDEMKRAYDLSAALKGERDPQTLTALANLAAYHYHMGNNEAALETGKKVYELRIKALGETHPETIDSLHRLALIHKQSGDAENALRMAEEAYSMQCKSLGREHPLTAKLLGSMARLYMDSSDNLKALELYERKCELETRILGEKHPVTLNSKGALVGCYVAVADMEKALALCEKVYALKSEVLGEDNISTEITRKFLMQLRKNNSHS